ncbi:hypothetical protein MNV49_006713 [Pseudohyphozyma bogoriensis]|nr:hypothetical protein MNV49_006713 [Pseudohyphozyma bogoriensis]
MVQPRTGDLFEVPNGCSLRPDCPTMQEVIRGFNHKNTIVWTIPEGLPFPSHFVLIHEHSDHFSLQTTEPVSLTEFNKRLTTFFTEKCTEMTQKEWCEKYPFA